MYGMIHRVARALAIERFGDAFWLAFSQKHGLTDAAFITAESYPDETTFALIADLAQAVDMTRPALLEAFGVHWIDFARRGAYANMMAIGGASLPAFIANLDRLHTGLAVAMPGSRMPSFRLLADTPDHLRLRYVSERRGLEPFVVGLMRGLCDMFCVEADVHCDLEADDGVIFEIRYRIQKAA